MIRNLFRFAQPADTNNSTGSILAAVIAGVGIAAAIVTWAVQQPAGGTHARPVSSASAPATLSETARRLILGEQPRRAQRVIEPRRTVDAPAAAVEAAASQASGAEQAAAGLKTASLEALGSNLRGADAHYYALAMQAIRTGTF